MSLKTGLVAYWKMDEASGNRSDSVASHTMTDNNTVASIAGKISNAGDFTPANSEFLNASDHADFDFTTAFTLQTWINIDNLTTDIAIATKWDHNTQESWAFQSDSTNSDEIKMFIADALNDGGANNVRTTNANLLVDTWYHIITIYDGSQGVSDRVKFYRNTTQLTTSVTGTIATSLQNSTADVRLGKFGGTLDRYFDGLIDEVGLWNRVLTSNEISQLYNSGNGLSFDNFGSKGRVMFMI